MLSGELVAENNYIYGLERVSNITYVNSSKILYCRLESGGVFVRLEVQNLLNIVTRLKEIHEYSHINRGAYECIIKVTIKILLLSPSNSMTTKRNRQSKHQSKR